MTRSVRIVALLVLLLGAFQIAMCAADCDCFLPSVAGISSHPSSQGDADGCLCCAQHARVSGLVGVPNPVLEGFTSSRSAVPIPQDGTFQIDLPPRF